MVERLVVIGVVEAIARDQLGRPEQADQPEAHRADHRLGEGRILLGLAEHHWRVAGDAVHPGGFEHRLAREVALLAEPVERDRVDQQHRFGAPERALRDDGAGDRDLLALERAARRAAGPRRA